MRHHVVGADDLDTFDLRRGSEAHGFFVTDGALRERCSGCAVLTRLRDGVLEHLIKGRCR